MLLFICVVLLFRRPPFVQASDAAAFLILNLIAPASTFMWQRRLHSEFGCELGENRFRAARVSLSCMKTFTAVVERSPETGLFVGFIPGFPGAHTQAESLDELNANLREVLAMLLEDGEPHIEAEFIGTQLVQVG